MILKTNHEKCPEEFKTSGRFRFINSKDTFHISHIVPRPTRSSDVLLVPGPPHDGAAVGVVSGAGVAFNCDEVAVLVDGFQDAGMLRLGLLSAEIKHEDVPGLESGRYPLASSLVPVRKDGAAAGLIEVEASLCEHPPDEPQAPWDAILASSKAVLLPVGPGWRFHNANLPRCDGQHSIAGLRYQRFHFSHHPQRPASSGTGSRSKTR